MVFELESYNFLSIKKSCKMSSPAINISAGGSTFYHEVREVHKDAVSVSRLRQCGAILVGKANMHEFGLGTTGNNPHYGYPITPMHIIKFSYGTVNYICSSS